MGAVVNAMQDGWGNPSSAHRRGAGARQILERARDATAALLRGIGPDDVVLTSGGTEGSNTFLAAAGADSTVVISAVEHPATRSPAERAVRRGAKLIVVPVDRDGTVDPEDFRKAAAGALTSELFVSVQWANGETGVVQPLPAVVAAIQSVRSDALIHVDAAQAVGRIRTAAIEGVTAFTFSGHKLHGPQGIGGLAYGENSRERLPALMNGGGQERARRSGTQNVAGAAGLAVALETRAAGFDEAVRKMAAMRDGFECRVTELCPGAAVNGRMAPRIPNTTNIRFPGADGMSLVARLDAQGIRCSQGSACASGRPEPSFSLRAMGLNEQDAYSSIRFSFSVLNTEDEVEKAAHAIRRLFRKAA